MADEGMFSQPASGPWRAVLRHRRRPSRPAKRGADEAAPSTERADEQLSSSELQFGRLRPDLDGGVFDLYARAMELSLDPPTAATSRRSFLKSATGVVPAWRCQPMAKWHTLERVVIIGMWQQFGEWGRMPRSFAKSHNR